MSSLREWNIERGIRAQARRNAWIERYKICSSRGRFYSRPEVRSIARRFMGIDMPYINLVDEILDDDKWMRQRCGYTPRALANEIESEALRRWKPNGP